MLGEFELIQRYFMSPQEAKDWGFGSRTLLDEALRQQNAPD